MLKIESLFSFQFSVAQILIWRKNNSIIKGALNQKRLKFEIAWKSPPKNKKSAALKKQKININYRVRWRFEMTWSTHKNITKIPSSSIVSNHSPCNIQVLHTTILDEWVVGTVCGAQLPGRLFSPSDISNKLSHHFLLHFPTLFS